MSKRKVAQSKRVTKRTAKAKPPATKADRRLLAKAEREAAEGARINASFAVIDASTAAPEGKPYIALPLHEVQSVLIQLRELTHVAVDAWACRDDMTDGLEGVLVALHAARTNLESETKVALARSARVAEQRGAS